MFSGGGDTQASGAYGAAKHAAWIATCTAATCVFTVGVLFTWFCYNIGVAENSSGTPHSGSLNAGYALAVRCTHSRVSAW
jgi:hypothetical protein